MIINFIHVIDCVDKKNSMMIADSHRAITGYDIINPTENYFSSDTLYLGKASNLPKNLSSIINSNLILFQDSPLPNLLKTCNTVNLILIKDVAALLSIEKKVKRIFNNQIKINNFTQNLLKQCENNSTLDEMLNYAYFVIGNPVMLVDPALFLIKQVGMDSVYDEPIIASTLEDGFLPEKYLTDVIYKETQASVPQENIIVYETQLLNNKLVASRIIKNNKLLGYLKVIETNKTVSELEEKYMTILSKYLSIRMNDFSEFLLNSLDTKPLKSSFLIALLEKKILDPEKINQRGKSLNLNFTGINYVITVKANFALNNTDSLYILKRRLSTILNEDSIFVYDGNLVILLNIQQANLTNRHKEDFIDIIEANNSRAFFSLPFYKISEFQKHYIQTKSCMQIADNLNITKPIIKYGDYIVEHMLIHFNDTYCINDLINPSINTLIKVDDEENSELLGSLFCLLKHGNNFTSASKELNIHYNTLKYRINRIMELTDLDLTNSEVAFSLLISKKIYELVSKH